MESRIELQVDTQPLLARFETLKAFLVQFPDKAGEVARLFFHEGEFRQELLSIRQVPAVRAGELNVSFDLSDAGLELMRALIAGEIDDCGVVE